MSFVALDRGCPSVTISGRCAAILILIVEVPIRALEGEA